MTVKISVIIPHYGSYSRHDWTRIYLALLSYVYQTLPRRDYEIILVDDGSEWDIERLIEEWKINLPIRIIKQSHQGICSAYEKGIEAARSPNVLLGIDDNILACDLLEQHVSCLKVSNDSLVWGREYHMHALKNSQSTLSNLSKIFGVRFEENNFPGKIDYKFLIQLFDNLVNLSVITEKYQDIEDHLTINRSSRKNFGNWLTMRVGNQSLSKRIYEKIGGIDLAFNPSGWYMDLEFGYRLCLNNINFLFNKDALMVHLSHKREEVAILDEPLKHQYFYWKHKDENILYLPFFFKSKMKIEEYLQLVSRLKNIKTKESSYAESMY